MSLIRWSRYPFKSPYELVQTMQDEVNRIFDGAPWGLVSPQRWGLATGQFIPPLDLYDNADKLVARVDLPGLKKENIEVSVIGDTLTVKGEKHTEEKGQMTHSERVYGAFSRSITLPVSVDPDQVTASYRNGVLEVSLPKRQESKPRQITVSA